MSSDDLIDFSPTLTPQPAPLPSTVPVPTSTSASSQPSGHSSTRWTLLQPDRTGSQPSTSPHPALPPVLIDDRDNKTKDRNLVALAIKSSPSGQQIPSPHQTSGKNVPLPLSPITRQTSIDTDADLESQYGASVHSDDTTQSKLSAAAKPFEAPPKRITVMRKSAPPEFIPAAKSSPATSQFSESDHGYDQAQDQWQGPLQVQADQMDPGFYQPGYGGHSALGMYPTAPPAFLPAPPKKIIKISAPQPELKKVKSASVSEASRPMTPVSTPSKSGRFDSLANSPVSSRVMRDHDDDKSSGSSSPALSLKELTFGPETTSDIEREVNTTADYAEDTPESSEEHPTHVEGIIAQFRSVSLSAKSVSDAADDEAAQNAFWNPENASDARHPFREEYEHSQDGRLSPEHTGSQHKEVSGGDEHGDENDQQSQVSERAGGDDTFVTPDTGPDPMESLAEIDELERAWANYRTGYGSFSGSIDEVLVRLKKELTKHLDYQTRDISNHVNSSSDVRVANARYLAQQSQLKMTRNKLEAARDEIERLERLVGDLQNSAEHTVVRDRVREEEMSALEEKVDKWEQRNRVLVARHLRLQEDHEVLIEQSKKNATEPFAVVLLDGDGRMFEPDLLRQGHKGGLKMAERLISKLDKLYEDLDLGTKKPRIILQLFTDVKRASGELIAAGYIRDQVGFSDFLDGFQSANGLSSVILVKDNSGSGEEYLPGIAICERAKFYASLSDCTMVVFGAGWDKPYGKCIEELRLQGHGSKVHALRSTTRLDTDPFKKLGGDKLLHISHLFSTSISSWMSAIGQSKRPEQDRKRSTDFGSAAPSESSRGTLSTTTTITRPRSPRAEPAASRHKRTESRELISPLNSPPPFRSRLEPSWTTIKGPSTRTMSPMPRRAAARIGGSLLDQMEHQSQSSRASSPGSDRTEVPSNSGRSYETLEIPIDPSEGSIGGSPPESDSDDPSVPVPHSARKYVRRPIPFNDGADDDSVSEYSSVSAASGSTQPASRSDSRKPSNMYPQSASTSKIPYFTSGANAITPGKPAPAPAAPPAAGPKGSLASRMSSFDTPRREAELKRARQASSGGSNHWAHEVMRSVAGGHSARRRAGQHKDLSELDPAPCHTYYLKGRCANRQKGCKYGHEYHLSDQYIEMLTLLAKGLKCWRVKPECNDRDEDCIYSHRCPRGRSCTFGGRCWFIDDDGRHLN